MRARSGLISEAAKHVALHRAAGLHRGGGVVTEGYRCAAVKRVGVGSHPCAMPPVSPSYKGDLDPHAEIWRQTSIGCRLIPAAMTGLPPRCCSGHRVGGLLRKA